MLADTGPMLVYIGSIPDDTGLMLANAGPMLANAGPILGIAGLYFNSLTYI